MIAVSVSVSVPTPDCCCSTADAGAGAGAGVDATGSEEMLDSVGTPFPGFSLLKTLLIRFTYLPRLLRRSPSCGPAVAAATGGGRGVDMVAAKVQCS